MYMKKYILSSIILLLAGVNTAWGQTNVAETGGIQYESLQSAITNAAEGGTITLLTNIDLASSYQIIDKAVTIDGGTNQYEIKGTGSHHGTDTEATIVLQGAGNVTLKNLKVTNPSDDNNGVGIKGTAYSGKLTIDNCEITVPMRGVNVETIAEGFSMDITGSTIQSNVADPKTTYVDNVDSRGISFSDDDELATEVTITNTTIQGFKNDIYVGENKKNLKLTMNGVKAYGLYMLNLSGKNSTVNLNGGTTFSACTGGGLVTDETAYTTSTNIIYLDEATKTASANNVLNATTLEAVSIGSGIYKLGAASAATGVAQIGNAKYATLQAAVDAAQQMGGEVTVNIIDDISGETVTINENANFKLTIDGKKDDSSNYTVDAVIVVDGLRGNGGSTTNGASVTLQNIAFVKTTATDGIQASHYPHHLTIQNCTYSGFDNDKWFLNASVDGPLYGVTVKNVTVEKARLIYANMADDAVFQNITATNDCKVGFNVKTSGTALIENCQVTTGKYAFRDYNDGYAGTFTLKDNTFISTSAAADEGAIVNRGGAEGSAHINVESGTYIGALKVLNNKKNVLVISGGQFSAPVGDAEYAGYFAEGLCGVNGLYEGDAPNGVGTAVASITAGETTIKFATFEAAVDAATSGETIELLANITDAYTMSEGQTLKVKKNGKSITVKAPDYFVLKSSTSNDVTTYTLAEADIELTKTNGAVSYIAFNRTLSSSGTYKLLKDITATGYINPGAMATDATIDLNGHTLTSTDTDEAILLNRTGSETSTASYHKTFNLIDSSENGGGKLVVNPNAKHAILLNNGSPKATYNDVIIGKGVTIEGGCVSMLSDHSTLIVEGAINGGNNFAIATNGNTVNTNITIKDGAVLTSTGTAMYLPGTGTTTIKEGAKITGSTGIYIKSATLNIEGGEITGNGEKKDYEYWDNGCHSTGDALVVDNCGYPGGRPTVNVTGGTFTSTNADAIASYSYGDGNAPIDHFVHGGYFSNEISEDLVEEGKVCVPATNKPGYYTIGGQIQIIHADNTIDSYDTLAEAISHVVADDTIRLMANISLNADINPPSTNGTFTLDFNGHSINNGNYHVKLASGQAMLTDEETDIFAPADPVNCSVVKQASGNNTYPHKYNVVKSLNSPDITITVANVIYDGLYHGVEGQNPVSVTVYDANVPGELLAGDNGAYTISMVPTSSYSLVDFGNSADNVYKYARTYTGAIIIEGKPEAGYTGSITVDFTIAPRDINDVTVEGHNQPYTETGYTPDDNETTGIKKLVTLKYNDIPLAVSTDYTIDVDATKTYKEAGTYPEVITLTAVEGGNFTGSRKVNFYIGNVTGTDIASCNVEATTVYNGSTQTPTGEGTTPTLIVRDASTNVVLVQGTDYTITIKNETGYEYIDAKTYTDAITITGIGDYYNTKVIDYIITPKDIAECDITASTPFTGSVINPADIVEVLDGTTQLAINSDYTLTVSNGYTYLNPQTYANAITVTGMGNYIGSITTDFVITTSNAINLASAAVVLSKQAYTGADLKPTAATTTVTVNGTALSSDYYDFSFVPEGDNFYKDAKVYSNAIIITAKSTQTTYYGTAVGNYIIEPRDLSDTGIIVTTTDLSYLNTEQDVTVEVKYGNNVIPATNYTYTPEKVTEAGKHIITINAVENSNLVGSTTAVQWVYKSLDGDYAADFSVEPDPIPTQNWTGEAIKPTIVVKDKDRVMQLADANEGDYSIAYSNNIDEGEATITITGTWAYSGTITKHFTIVKEYFTVGDFTYHHAKEGEEVNLGNTDGTNNILATTATGKVEVPETVDYQGKTFTVTGIEEKALGGEDITAVVLPQSIAEIEDNAFLGAVNTRYVDASAMKGYIPETLTRDFDGPFGGLPKQALVYLTGTNIKGENYVYKPGDSDDYYCELFKIYDDFNGSQTGFSGNDYKWAFENPHTFTAYTLENTRMLTAGKHYTTCLPYSINIPKNMKAYTLDATSDQIFGFKEVIGTIDAYTPYVLIPTASGQLLSTTNVEIPVFPADANVTETKLNGTVKGNFTFYGSMRYMEGNDAAGKYIMQYNNGNPTWKKIIDTNAGFTEESNKACVLPMRAYIINEVGGSREFFEVIFTNIDGTTIALDKLEFDDQIIYDLSGRKVQNLEHGHTYIINGKKIMIK